MNDINPLLNSQTALLTIRVYGVLIVDDQVLLSDEYHKGMEITKFPGGGLQTWRGNT